MREQVREGNPEAAVTELMQRFYNSWRAFFKRLLKQLMEVEEYFPEAKRASIRRRAEEEERPADVLLGLFGSFALYWWPELYPVQAVDLYQDILFGNVESIGQVLTNAEAVEVAELYQRALFNTLIMSLAMDVALNEGPQGFVKMGYAPDEAELLAGLYADPHFDVASVDFGERHE